MHRYKQRGEIKQSHSLVPPFCPIRFACVPPSGNHGDGLIFPFLYLWWQCDGGLFNMSASFLLHAFMGEGGRGHTDIMMVVGYELLYSLQHFCSISQSTCKPQLNIGKNISAYIQYWKLCWIGTYGHCLWSMFRLCSKSVHVSSRCFGI